MIEIRKKLKLSSAAKAAYGLQVKARLTLPFELRQKSRLRAKLDDSGEDVGLMLPRGEVLRGGDLVVASDGRIIEVKAQPEQVLHVTCSSAEDLARAAYHLGNRHVPVEVGEGYLRITADHVLEGMLNKLGATVESRDAPFEPESGAYGGGGMHAHADEHGHGGRIHEYGEPAHVHGPACGHDHHDHGAHAHAQDGHVHGPACGHDHDHGHDHASQAGHVHGPDCGHDHAPKAAPALAAIPVHVHGPHCNHGDHGHQHGHQQVQEAGVQAQHGHAGHEHAGHVHGPDCGHDHHGHEHDHGKPKSGG